MKQSDITITDEQALFSAHPHLFRHVPDKSRIRKALEAGFTLPGVTYAGDASTSVVESPAAGDAPTRKGGTDSLIRTSSPAPAIVAENQRAAGSALRKDDDPPEMCRVK